MSDAGDALDLAQESVCGAIERAAAEATPEQLGTLAHAVAEMRFGAQGVTRYEGGYDQRQVHRNERDRGPTGFGSDKRTTPE